MDIDEKLPWYDEYNLAIESRKIAEKGIEDLENPEKQLQRVKKFYSNLGADYKKNSWISQAEENISMIFKDENGRLNQLKREVNFGNILENAVKKQDDESIKALDSYKNDEIYAKLVKKIMFYIGVSKAKKEINYIKKAYEGINKAYPLEKTSLFVSEGVFYYVYYFRCLRVLLERYKGRETYDEVANQIKDRCYNARLMMNQYLTDMYLEDEIKLIFSEIEAIEDILVDE